MAEHPGRVPTAVRVFVACLTVLALSCGGFGGERGSASGDEPSGEQDPLCEGVEYGGWFSEGGPGVEPSVTDPEDPGDVERAMQDLLRWVERLADEGPEEIRGDARDATNMVEAQIDLLEDADFDVQSLDEERFDPEEYGAAFDAVNDWYVRTCLDEVERFCGPAEVVQAAEELVLNASFEEAGVPGRYEWALGETRDTARLAAEAAPTEVADDARLIADFWDAYYDRAAETDFESGGDFGEYFTEAVEDLVDERTGAAFSSVSDFLVDRCPSEDGRFCELVAEQDDLVTGADVDASEEDQGASTRTIAELQQEAADVAPEEIAEAARLLADAATGRAQSSPDELERAQYDVDQWAEEHCGPRGVILSLLQPLPSVPTDRSE